MSPALIGAYAGVALGIVSFVTLWLVAGAIEKKARTPQERRPVGILKAIALGDIVGMPILGYFLGPMVM